MGLSCELIPLRLSTRVVQQGCQKILIKVDIAAFRKYPG